MKKTFSTNIFITCSYAHTISIKNTRKVNIPTNLVLNPTDNSDIDKTYELAKETLSKQYDV